MATPPNFRVANDARFTDTETQIRDVIPTFTFFPPPFKATGAVAYIDRPPPGKKAFAFCDNLGVWHEVLDNNEVLKEMIWERDPNLGGAPIIRENTTNPLIDFTEDFVFGAQNLEFSANPTFFNKFFFDKSKGAFRAGTIDNANWDDVNRGVTSIGLGYNTLATSLYSVAVGERTTTQGVAAFAEGRATLASSLASHAEGDATVSASLGSHAEGRRTTSSNDGSHSEGRDTLASGASAHAEGQLTQATAENSHAEGGSSLATGLNSHAEGAATVASGPAAHAEGDDTQATGANAHSEGVGTLASGVSSHAEGQTTQATTTDAHAEGSDSRATFTHSHAGGLQSLTSFVSSFTRADGQISVRGDAQLENVVMHVQNTTVAGDADLETSVGSSLPFPAGDSSWLFLVETVQRQVGGAAASFFLDRVAISVTGGVAVFLSVASISSIAAAGAAVSYSIGTGSLVITGTNPTGIGTSNWVSVLRGAKVAA